MADYRLVAALLILLLSIALGSYAVSGKGASGYSGLVWSTIAFLIWLLAGFAVVRAAS